MSDTSLPAVEAVTSLRFKPLGIDTAYEHVVFMHAECPVCRAEGFAAQTRIVVHAGGRSLIATLSTISDGLLSLDQLSLSLAGQRYLGLGEGDAVTVSHVPVLQSTSLLRAKIYGHRLDLAALQTIIDDTVSGRLSELHLSAFVTACAGRLDHQEVLDLTRAMIAVGKRLEWPHEIVVDKHCVGGLPGNRTTPIVAAIVTACGLVMPKTSSRAITSPAGTADVMGVLTNVALGIHDIRRVVERTGGCLVWGGAVELSPADDILIRVERPLDLDSGSQLVASILSKKIAAGSTRALIDIPVGPTAKVRSPDAARELAAQLIRVGRELGLMVRPVITDGSQPIGTGIGPALEARDVLRVLRNAPEAPADLRERSLYLAGQVLEMAGKANGAALAQETLDSGRAWRQFQAICTAQGAFRDVPVAALTHAVVASEEGWVTAIDNRLLARIAKLAGAPLSPSAGVDLHARLGARVSRGQSLFTVHAEAPGEMRYALAYLADRPEVIRIGTEPASVQVSRL